MTTFTRRWLVVTIVGIVLAPITFRLGSYPGLSAAMASQDPPDKPFDEKHATSFSEARSRFAAMTEEGRNLYRAHGWTDVPFFLALGLASTGVLMTGWGSGYSRRTYAIVLMFTVTFVIFDAIESVLLATWFQNDGPTEPTVNALRFITPAKFASSLLTFPMLLLGLVLRFIRTRAATTPISPAK